MREKKNVHDFFQVLFTFVVAIGIKKTFKILTTYPAIFLMPVFSYWTIGPVKTVSTITFPFNCFDYKRRYLGVSYWHTWINTLITMICTLTGLFIWRS